MIALTYTLELIDPMLATGFGAGDPNSKRSLDYIPGSMVRGALIDAYLRREHKARLTIPEDATLEHDEYRCFLSNAVCYLHGYPEVRINNIPQRLLPTPRTWQRVKPVVGMIPPTLRLTDLYDPVVMDWPSVQTELPEDLAWQRAGGEGSYCWHDAESAYLHGVERIILDHTTRDRRKGRATREKGNLFRYDALAPGQSFAGIILTQTQHDAEFLQALLEGGRLSLGGARSAGYGRVEVKSCTIDPFWAGECEPVEEDLQPGSMLLLSALSAWVMIDEEGNRIADLSCEQVAAALQVDAASLEPLPTSTRRSLITIGGFNRSAGLPHPQQQVIAAGSTFAFRVLQPIPAARLQQLQEDGIGWRRLDGFGRVGVNWQQAARYQEHVERASSESKPIPHLPPAWNAFGQQIGERILRQEMEQRLQSDILARHIQRTPVSNSQLARVRAVLREALRQLSPDSLPTGDMAKNDMAKLGQAVIEPVTEFLQDLKPTAQEQLRRTRLRSEGQEVRLLVWLEGQIEAIQKGEPKGFPTLTPVTLGDFTMKPPPAWQIEYSLRLMDGVLAQAAKMAQKEQANGDN